MASPEEARAKLRHLQARPAQARHFEENAFYDDAAGSLRLAGRMLRLRRVPGQALLTYKGEATIADGVKSRAEFEVVVSDADALERILAGLGLLPRFRYQKYRESYRHQGAEIVIDETPIGTFFEIEAAPQEIHEVAAALGFSRQDYVLESYAALFLAGGGKGDMVFERPS